MLQFLSLLPGFNEGVALKLADFSKLKNILAHEYLDIRFNQIKKFIQESKVAYGEVLSFVKNLLNL